MSPTDILEFESRWPGNSPSKRARIWRDLGISDIRYYQLLLRSASSPDGIAAHPLTARRVREQSERRSRARDARWPLPTTLVA